MRWATARPQRQRRRPLQEIDGDRDRSWRVLPWSPCGFPALLIGANVLPLPGERKPRTRRGCRGSSALARVDEEFLAGGALVVDRDVGELQRLLQRHHLRVMAGKGGLEFGSDALAQLADFGGAD